VALGTPDGEVHGNRVPPDVATMQEIADVSGGEAFAVSERDRLESIYGRLGSQLTRKDAHRQITAGFAGGGLALVLLGAGMSLWWFGRVP
jgi:Ca-activated chloride channel family protein